MVSEPYGGRLINRVLAGRERERRLSDAKEMISIEVDRGAILDAEKIATGAYSPLEGFMSSTDYYNVVRNETLENGLPWTIPIILAPREEHDAGITGELRDGDEVALYYLGEPFAILHVEERFRFDKRELAEKVFRTVDVRHPNVKELFNMGGILLAGGVDLIQRVDHVLSRYELTPLETRRIFSEMRWEKIAAYQTRNPPHMAHEYIQRCTLEMVDGILIHPVTELKEDDFPPQATVEGYEFLIKNFYPKNRAVLATLSIQMRYAGSRAAIFLAIVRKNYGCTHFVVGRDIAGVGDYYEPYEAHEAMKGLDIGIEPIFFRESFYCKRCRGIVSERTCGHTGDDHVRISMSEVRHIISSGKEPPPQTVRPEIARILKRHLGTAEDPQRST
ncbi:sulfate adenylyltransferase [Candidatus Bathyarchaeota archaeon]|nr:sulfate adenylyltransferase [Candidatus Bathyarchaeota archaeon]